MDEALRELHGLHTVVETHQSTLSKYVVSVEHHLSESSSSLEHKDDRRRSAESSSKERSELDPLSGFLIVTVGCNEAWWSVNIEGSALRSLVSSGAIAHSIDAGEPTQDQCRRFVDRLQTAFRERGIMVGVKKSASNDVASWSSIQLYIDVEHHPLQLKLERLSDHLALVRSTNIALCNTPSAPSATAPASPTSHADSIPSLELHQLRRKYEAMQQALREERHKYRSLLAAPSAANARSGRRPVVGLEPMLQRTTQRSPSMLPQQPSSSPLSRSRSRLPSSISSSSSGRAAGPSSDDMDPPPPSQRTLSLVNPTRVRRADPSENQGFVGDDDEEFQ